jgi:hypothetical protein
MLPLVKEALEVRCPSILVAAKLALARPVVYRL